MHPWKQRLGQALVVVEGELSMGPFGGDFDGAISKAARELADYAIKTF